jgi:hypothetical protein
MRAKKLDPVADFARSAAPSRVALKDSTPEHARWSRSTVEMLRRMVAQQESELDDLRRQLNAAEGRLAAGEN